LHGPLSGLVAAVRFLTCIPLPGSQPSSAAELGRALVYFPAVGLALGLALVSVDWACAGWLGRPLIDFLLLAVLVTVSGALHLDGLIDTADGLPEPGPAEARLAAMRAPWAGPRGTLAGLGILLLQYSAISGLDASNRWIGLLLAPLLGRWAVVVCYVAFPYARRTVGLSLALKTGATRRVGLLATAFAAGVALLVSWPIGGALLALAGAVVLGSGRLAGARLGGMSGDIYGAVEQVVETLGLLMVPPLAAAIGQGGW